MDSRALAEDAETRLTEEHASVATARRFTRHTVASWSYPGSVDDVLLVVSELVTNAVLHGSGEPTLRLSGGAHRVRVEVADDNPALPAVREAGPDGGWGLRVIGQLGVDWGVTPRPDGGKVVWCDLVATRAQGGSGDRVAR